MSEFCSHPQIDLSRNLPLADDEVHVWRAILDLEAPRVRSLQRTLAPDEQARAERFYFRKDRERFIVARGLLRVILSRYLDTKPGQLRFCYGLRRVSPRWRPQTIEDRRRSRRGREEPATMPRLAADPVPGREPTDPAPGPGPTSLP